MSEYILTQIRKGFYLDSVALMRLSREVASVEGVVEAALMMGSPSNIEIMQNAGLLTDDCDALSNDLVLAVKANSESQAKAALETATEALDRPKESGKQNEAWSPRSLSAAVRNVPGANLALISVPGSFAASEARKALRRGLNVLMFSDNVSLEDELALKEEAQDLGLLMMGPDCGTAIINGAPLAFANVVNRGSIGVIGASGTGIQEVTTLISEAGQGISHAIGVGGRDLKKDIGGISTLVAMDALDNDDATRSVVLISKPPHPDVANTIVSRIAKSPKRYTVCFLGGEQMDLPPNAVQAFTLRGTADLVLEDGKIGMGYDMWEIAKRIKNKTGRGGQIRGLFCGGTLCAEAQVILRNGKRSVVSNACIPGVPPISEDAEPGADQLIDLGADEYTRGRAHPMIDPSLRDEMVCSALEDTEVSVILIDLVIGYGAHADPAGHLAEVLNRSGDLSIPVIASVTGTVGDPQNYSRQIEVLEKAGVVVMPSNAHVCELALCVALS